MRRFRIPSLFAIFMILFINITVIAGLKYEGKVTGMQVSMIDDKPWLVLRVEQLNHHKNINSCAIQAGKVTVNGNEVYMKMDYKGCSRVMRKPHKNNSIAIESEKLPLGQFTFFIDDMEAGRILKVNQTSYRYADDASY